MRLGLKLFCVALLMGLLAPSLAHAGSFICQEPGGKRLIQIDDKEVSRPGGKMEIYIDGEDILVGDIHAKATLVVSDDDIRPSAAGVIIASFDGDDLRHGRDGKVLFNYSHPDICPTSADNRIYSIEGDPLTKQQLVAGLYLLRPEWFKLSEAEAAEQQKAIKEAGEEADRQANADQVAGEWEMLNSNGPVEKTGKGTITVGEKKGDAYPVALDFTPGGGPTWNGVGVYANVSGDKLFYLAYGTPKTIGLCVYQIKGGTLEGKWYPWYLDGDAKHTGAETLAGPADLDGEFRIVSAAAPTSGAAYAGTVLIKPMNVVGASDSAKPYSLVWTIGEAKVYGIGIRSGDVLFVSSGAGPDVNVARFKIDNGSMTSDWFKLGSTEMGGSAAMKAN